MTEPVTKLVKVGTAGEKSRGPSVNQKARVEQAQLDMDKAKSLEGFLNPPRKST